MAVFSSNDIMNKIKDLDNWSFDSSQIHCNYQFKDFKEALSFVNKVGDEAQKMNHHPDIFLHSWNKVKISLSTHSEGGITEKDFKLAATIDNLV